MISDSELSASDRLGRRMGQTANPFRDLPGQDPNQQALQMAITSPAPPQRAGETPSPVPGYFGTQNTGFTGITPDNSGGQSQIQLPPVLSQPSQYAGVTPPSLNPWADGVIYGHNATPPQAPQNFSDPNQVRAYVEQYYASRGVQPYPTSVDYWVDKITHGGDPQYYMGRLTQADEFTGRPQGASGGGGTPEIIQGGAPSLAMALFQQALAGIQGSPGTPTYSAAVQPGPTARVMSPTMPTPPGAPPAPDWVPSWDGSGWVPPGHPDAWHPPTGAQQPSGTPQQGVQDGPPLSPYGNYPALPDDSANKATEDSARALLQQILANPHTLNDQAVSQLKEKGKETAVALQKQTADQLALDAISRGVAGGGASEAGRRRSVDAMLSDIIRGNRDIDLQKVAQDRTDELGALDASTGFLTGAENRSLSRYNSELQGYFENLAAQDRSRGLSIQEQLGNRGIDVDLSRLNEQSRQYDLSRQLALAELQERIRQFNNNLGYNYASLNQQGQSDLIHLIYPDL